MLPLPRVGGALSGALEGSIKGERRTCQTACVRAALSIVEGDAGLTATILFSVRNPGTSHQPLQDVNMDLSNATAWFTTTAMRLHRLCPFGEVQQDFLLSCLTIGQAYCLLKVLK
jgi:hypothetical protein